MDKNDWKIIWLRFQTGDKEALSQIYNRHIDSLYRYGCKLCHNGELVKDAIQEIFIELFDNRMTNRIVPGNLKFYLILALKRNLVKKLVRNRHLVPYRRSYQYMFEPQYSVETKLIDEERQSEISRKIADALNQLTSRQKGSCVRSF